MINPDKYIRKAFFQALTGANLRVFDKRVPDDNPKLTEYLVISSQTKLQQGGKQCKSWDCTVVLDLFRLDKKSYVDSVGIDDLEETVLNTIQRDNLTLESFYLSSVQLDGTPRDLSFDTNTHTIHRKVVTYRVIVNELAAGEIVTRNTLPFKLA